MQSVKNLGVNLNKITNLTENQVFTLINLFRNVRTIVVSNNSMVMYHRNPHDEDSKLNYTRVYLNSKDNGYTRNLSVKYIINYKPQDVITQIFDAVKKFAKERIIEMIR